MQCACSFGSWGSRGTRQRPARSSNLVHAVVDSKLDSRDVASVIRCQENHGFGDFIRRADTPQTGAGGHLQRELNDLLGGHAEAGVITLCWHDAGTDGVNTDFARLEVGRPAASEGPDGGFAGDVDAEGLRAFRGSGRSRQDDRAAVFYQRQGFLHREKRAPDVVVECFVKMLFRYCAKRSKGAASGIGDQDVNVSFLFFACPYKRSRSARLAMSPRMPVTLRPTFLTASSSSYLRRPVMKT